MDDQQNPSCGPSSATHVQELALNLTGCLSKAKDAHYHKLLKRHLPTKGAVYPLQCLSAGVVALGWQELVTLTHVHYQLPCRPLDLNRKVHAELGVFNTVIQRSTDCTKCIYSMLLTLTCSPQLTHCLKLSRNSSR